MRGTYLSVKLFELRPLAVVLSDAINCGGLNTAVGRQQRRLAALAASLDALSPLKVLGRGYSIARREDGSVLARVEQAVPDTRFRLRLADGEVPCRVERKDD